VRALLDTHVLLWAITDDQKLSEEARAIFSDGDNHLFFSAAGLWEILIKVQIGRLLIPKPAGKFIEKQLVQNNIEVLPIQMHHVWGLESLPMHHRDPFDRILLAQSLQEGLPIVSADKKLRTYAAEILW